jgi:hypothetical protein
MTVPHHQDGADEESQSFIWADVSPDVCPRIDQEPAPWNRFLIEPERGHKLRRHQAKLVHPCTHRSNNIRPHVLGRSFEGRQPSVNNQRRLISRQFVDYELLQLAKAPEVVWRPGRDDRGRPDQVGKVVPDPVAKRHLRVRHERRPEQFPILEVPGKDAAPDSAASLT